MKIDPNAPAYPNEPESLHGETGLTIRQHFAGLAMQGLMSPLDAGYFDATQAGFVARASVLATDALIAALNQEPTP